MYVQIRVCIRLGEVERLYQKAIYVLVPQPWRLLQATESPTQPHNTTSRHAGARPGNITAIPTLRDLHEQTRTINLRVKEGGCDVHVVDCQSESGSQACKLSE